VSLRSTVLVLVLALTGCGEDSPTVTADRPIRPTGGEVVVQVATQGGLLPPEAAVGRVPSVTVLGDGTVITPAPVPELYPGPAIAPLQATTVDAARVDDLVAQAQRLGLLDGPLELGLPLVMDAPETIVTITADGATHRHFAHALTEAEEPASGLTEQEVANRRALRAFVETTRRLPPGDRSWTPTAVAVHGLGPYQPDPELAQKEMAWPLRRPPATAGPRPCTLVDGDDAAVLLGVLARASARTPWVVDGTPHSLAFRPVLPGQPGCPS
jgi:hypothetical protein